MEVLHFIIQYSNMINMIVYCLKVFDGLLFSGGGDKSIRVWDARVDNEFLVLSNSDRMF